jgi:hypothetical protein
VDWPALHRHVKRGAPAGDGDVEFVLARGNRHGLINVARQIATPPAMVADDRVPLGEAEGRIGGRKLSETESNSTRRKPR